MLALPLLSPSSLLPCTLGFWMEPGTLSRVASALQVSVPPVGEQDHALARTNRKRAGTNVAKARLEQKPLPSTTAGGWALRFILSARARGLSWIIRRVWSQVVQIAVSSPSPLSWPATRLSADGPHHLTASFFRGYSDSGSMGIIGKSLVACGVRALLTVVLPTSSLLCRPHPTARLSVAPARSDVAQLSGHRWNQLLAVESSRERYISRVALSHLCLSTWVPSRLDCSLPPPRHLRHRILAANSASPFGTRGPGDLLRFALRPLSVSCKRQGPKLLRSMQPFCLARLKGRGSYCPTFACSRHGRATAHT